MIRIIAKLFVFTLALTPFVYIEPLFAAQVAWISSAGNDSDPCTATQPCMSFQYAAVAVANAHGSQINCINSPGPTETGIGFSINLIIDCAGVFVVQASGFPAFMLTGSNQIMKIRNLAISGAAGGASAISVIGGGTLILENCIFENMAGIALDIEPTGPLNLVIKNSRVSNNAAAGVLLKPASGGSVTATFDGVTITNNAGGLKTDTTNGAVRLDISNSTISNNANNGLIAIGGAGGQNMVSVGNGVIASNSQAGIEASGGNAAVLVNNTLLDSNAGGAISSVSGGRILTYQNNRTIGLPGTGFTGTAAPN